MWGSGWDKGFSRGQGVVLLDFLEEVASQLALENEEHLTDGAEREGGAWEKEQQGQRQGSEPHQGP